MGLGGGVGSGQSGASLSSDYLKHVIELNVDNTSLMKFNLNKEDLKNIIETNRLIVEGYFKGISLGDPSPVFHVEKYPHYRH